MRSLQIAIIPLLSFASNSGAQAPLVRSATGANAAAIQATVDTFNADLGDPLNGTMGPQPAGRRAINWDGVPDADAAPGRFPGDFFNRTSTRGLLMTTPGTGFQVSADSNNPSNTGAEFENLNSTYPATFGTFSPERLFTSLGSNEIEVRFVLSGTNTKAAVKGFGAVFSDVDLANTTSIEYFSGARSLGVVFVEASSEGLSFLGASFPEAIVTRARLVLGNSSDGPGLDDVTLSSSNPDIVVVDDFFYGEPLPISIVQQFSGLDAALQDLVSPAFRTKVLKQLESARNAHTKAEAFTSDAEDEKADKSLAKSVQGLGKLLGVLATSDVPAAVQADLHADICCLLTALVERQSSNGSG